MKEIVKYPEYMMVSPNSSEDSTYIYMCVCVCATKLDLISL